MNQKLTIIIDTEIDIDEWISNQDRNEDRLRRKIEKFINNTLEQDVYNIEMEYGEEC